MPLLTIAIPTYNRASYLSDVIESIIKQDAFLNTDEVEIVICDNCSTDNTEYVAKKYVEKFPNKIFYYKNEKNIGFDNFERVMSYGKGEFLKLNNDTLIHNENTLKIMLDVIKQNKEIKRQIFFLNGTLKTDDENFVCKNLDYFVEKVSYYTTWIASFGLWNEDFRKIRNLFLEKNSTQIPQTYLLYDIISNKKAEIFVNNKKLFESVVPQKKGGYNIAEVFGKNYLTILREFVGTKNGLSTKTYQKEKRAILDFINGFYFDFYHQYAFQKTGYLKFMLPLYCRDFYFWRKLIIAELRIGFSFIYDVTKTDDLKIIKLFRLIKFNKKRKQN